MNKVIKSGKDFVGYEYKEVVTTSEMVSLLLDCYQNFGWLPDENITNIKHNSTVIIHLKRDRRIVNKAELTRMQRQFEGCIEELDTLKRAKTLHATMVAILVGVIGTAFIAGAVFAVTAEPPQVLLCILLAIPGFLGWILPLFLYQKLTLRKTKQLAPLIEEKYEELYHLCEKGNKLLQL